MAIIVGERCNVCRKTAPMSSDNYDKGNRICFSCDEKKKDSNKPKLRTRFELLKQGAVAQLGEHQAGSLRVVGSIPSSSTK